MRFERNGLKIGTSVKRGDFMFEWWFSTGGHASPRGCQ